MKPRIFIDPGHGGSDPGAAGPGIMEKDLNLLVARELATILDLSKFEAALSRSDNKTTSLVSRTENSKRFNADLFISIHHNGFNNPAANGYEIIYQLYRENDLSEKSFRFAYILNNEFGNTFFPALHPRGLKHRQNTAKGGEYFHVLRETDCPAIITECGFLTSPADITTLKNKDFPRKQAEAIKAAIELYYHKQENSKLISFIAELKSVIAKYEQNLVSI